MQRVNQRMLKTRTIVRIIAVAMFVFTSITTNGQVNKKKKLASSGFNFGLGVDQDHYHRMTLDHLISIAENPNDLRRNLNDFSEVISSSTAGLGLYVSKSFNPFNSKSETYRQDREFRVGVGFHSPKESMITYRNKEIDTSIIFCSLYEELTLEVAFVQNGFWGKSNQWRWTYGISGNSSVTFSNELITMEGKYFRPDEHPSVQERLEKNVNKYLAKPIVFNRVFLSYGVHRIIKDHWSLGIDARRGFGWQSVVGGPTTFIRKSGYFCIGTSYSIAGFR